MYGKIFTQMYEGTLASRGPWEALVTFQQLIVLANRHGEVDMTADAISRRTTIPLEIIKRGIEELAKPDPESRSPELEGRRIVLLDEHRAWGWKLVNYDKYRKIRSEEERREYQRVLMANRRSKAKKLAPVSNVSPCSMQYAESSKHQNPSAAYPAAVALGSPQFHEFWQAYPKKVDKQEALKSWVKGLCDGHLGEVLAGLEKWKATEQWSDPEKIPYPSTWLNKRRWKEAPEKNDGTRQATSREQQRAERSQQAIERALGHRSGLADALRSDLPRGDNRRDGPPLRAITEGHKAGNTAQGVHAGGKVLQVPPDAGRDT